MKWKNVDDASKQASNMTDDRPTWLLFPYSTYQVGIFSLSHSHFLSLSLGFVLMLL